MGTSRCLLGQKTLESHLEALGGKDLGLNVVQDAVNKNAALNILQHAYLMAEDTLIQCGKPSTQTFSASLTLLDGDSDSVDVQLRQKSSTQQSVPPSIWCLKKVARQASVARDNIRRLGTGGRTFSTRSLSSTWHLRLTAAVCEVQSSNCVFNKHSSFPSLSPKDLSDTKLQSVSSPPLFQIGKMNASPLDGGHTYQHILDLLCGDNRVFGGRAHDAGRPK